MPVTTKLGHNNDPKYAKHAFKLEMYSKTHFPLHMFNDMDRPHTKNQSVSQKEDYDKYGLSSLIKWIYSKVWTGQRLIYGIEKWA